MSEPLVPQRSPEVFMADVVLPNRTNSFGTMFGGDVLAMMDKAAAIAAVRFCRRRVVTASTEHVDFRLPIHQGEIIEARARVIFAGNTSMITRVHVFAEHPLKGDQRLCTTGYISMVAINTEGKTVPVPPLLVDDNDSEAQREYRIGEEIRAALTIRRRRQSSEKNQTEQS